MHTFGFKVVNINVILSISKYFDEGFKKRDHSGNSNLEEKSKKIKYSSPGSYTYNGKAFEEGLESPE